jgi:hypothetical protein
MSKIYVDEIHPKTTGGVVSASGHIIQVKHASFDSAYSSSASANDVGLSLDITPTSTNSKLFISCSVLWAVNNNGGYLSVCDGSGNVLEQPSARGSRGRHHFGSIYGSANFVDYNANRETVQFIHEPNTTSAFTVKLRSFNLGSTTVYVNRNKYDNDRVYDPSGISFLTVMEIGG